MPITNHYIPEGMQDFLPDECYNKRQIEDMVRNSFYSSGYNEVETPAFEHFDMFAYEKSPIEQQSMYKILEAGSPILVLRPDFTMPIARLTANKFKNTLLPIRLFYIGNVYRYEDIQIAKQREIAQAGAELLGISGPEGDGEIIAMAIQSLIDLKLTDFKIDIGQVEFFKGLIEEAQLNNDTAEKIRIFIDHKDMLGLELFLKSLSVSDEIKQILWQLPRLYGNIDVLNEATDLTKNRRCLDAIDNIYQVYEILKDYGFERYISFDLGMVQSINYYTGIIFRGIIRSLSYPICGGGRYDNLVRRFGYDIPATGFALGIKRILVSIERQNGLRHVPNIDVLISFDRSSRKQAYKMAEKLKTKRQRIELFYSGSWSSAKDYALEKGIKKVLLITDNIIKEVVI